MLNFDNIEDLVSYMFENLNNDDNLVSVISSKEMTVEIIRELLDYENVVLNSCDIDANCDYNREYIVTLFDDVDSDNWYVNVEKSYCTKNGKYLAIGGYVLFHEDANSKAMIDMQNSELSPLIKHDLFTIGDVDQIEDNVNNEPGSENDSDDSGYNVTVTVGFDTDESEKFIRDIGRNMRRELSGMFDWLYRPYPYIYEYHRPTPIRFSW